ncbi:9082_t:CDS:2, partial [Funneliformis geosporum]
NKATRIYRDFLNDVINVKKKYTNEEEITTALTNRTINSEEEGFDNRLSQDIQLISEDIARAIKEGDFIGIEPIRYFVEGGVFPWDKQTPEELDHQITKLENEIKAKFLLIKKASQGTVKLNLKKNLTGKTCENKNQDLERAVDNLVNQFNSQNLTELENI